MTKVLSLNLEKCKRAQRQRKALTLNLRALSLPKSRREKKQRKAKDFAKADAIRDELLAKGIVIKDTREGVVWHKAE